MEVPLTEIYHHEPSDESNEPMLSEFKNAQSSNESNREMTMSPYILEYEKSSSFIRKDFTTIDWFFSIYRDRRRSEISHKNNARSGLKGKCKNLYLAIQSWIVLFLVGVATASTGSLIHILSKWLSDLKFGYCKEYGFWINQDICCVGSTLKDCVEWNDWSDNYWLKYFIYCSFATIFAGIGSRLVFVYAHKAIGSGIPVVKTILGGFIVRRVFGIRVLFIKSIGLMLAVGSGLCLGKEGPLVHIACCWGHILSRRFSKYKHNEVKKREILSASVSAGVSAAFGAPIGGVLFSLENVSSYFPPKTLWRAFWCAITAALVLNYTDPFQTHKLVQFQVVNPHVWNWFELFPFMCLGCLGGLIGASFLRCYFSLLNWRTRNLFIKNHPVFEVLVITFFTAILSFPNIFTRRSSAALLSTLYSTCKTFNNSTRSTVENQLCSSETEAFNIVLLLLAGLVKFILMTLTMGLYIPAGVLLPSLCVGALVGRAMGVLIKLLHNHVGNVMMFSICTGQTQCIIPGTYAVVGSAAVLAGTTRMTISLTVIMFELTGGLDYIGPIMISTIISKVIADLFGKKGMFDRLIHFYGFPYIDAGMELDDTRVGGTSDIMVRNPTCITVYGETLQSLQELLDCHSYHGFPIINNKHDRVVYGYISRSNLKREVETSLRNRVSLIMRVHFSIEPSPFHCPEYLDFSEEVDQFPIRVLPSTPADRILDLFKGLGLRVCLVASKDGRLIGLIKKKKSLNVYSRLRL